ncbi:glycosyltransferase [Photobacterium japonica]|uniref:glycosyltransferase n=1 Tax=Photobacterium japonica TaxID=2910235 RepID=UPI003D0C0670
MQLLTITTLYPNANDTKHGIFVENRLRHLQKHHPDVGCTVIAPVPWFPSSHPRFGEYARYADVPRQETRHGITIYHPRYLAVPKIGMQLLPVTLHHCILKQVRALLKQGEHFDCIDGHYFYPEGVAVEKVAAQVNLPFTMTARGTDINLIPSFPRPLRQIQQVFRHSHHNLAVCEALRQTMILHGANPASTTTARNGVDLALFPFVDHHQQHALRTELDLPVDRPLFISVGWLIERKGHHLVIEAMQSHPEAMLLIAGTGPNEKALKQQAQQQGMGDRIRFLGGVDQPTLARYFAACDLSILASDREGWANVLLESMACGTPVVATNIWGTPEVVNCPEAGILVERDAVSLAKGIETLLHQRPDRQATRHHAERFSWEDTAHLLYHLFEQIIASTTPSSSAAPHTSSPSPHKDMAS